MASRLYLARGPGHSLGQAVSLLTAAVIGFIAIFLGALVLSLLLTGAFVLGVIWLARRWWSQRRSELRAHRQPGQVIDAEYRVVAERAGHEEPDR